MGSWPCSNRCRMKNENGRKLQNAFLSSNKCNLWPYQTKMSAFEGFKTIFGHKVWIMKIYEKIKKKNLLTCTGNIGRIEILSMVPKTSEAGNSGNQLFFRP